MYVDLSGQFFIYYTFSDVPSWIVSTTRDAPYLRGSGILQGNNVKEWDEYVILSFMFNRIHLSSFHNAQDAFLTKEIWKFLSWIAMLKYSGVTPGLWFMVNKSFEVVGNLHQWRES